MQPGIEPVEVLQKLGHDDGRRVDRQDFHDPRPVAWRQTLDESRYVGAGLVFGQKMNQNGAAAEAFLPRERAAFAVRDLFEELVPGVEFVGRHVVPV